MSATNELKNRLEQIQERIALACSRAGRPPSSVRLIAVTKTQPVATLQALLDIGVTDLGENRVNEIIEKVPQLRGEYTMHLIGHLQTNKVRRVLPAVSMIQSIDRVQLINRIEACMPPEETIKVLVEVNTSGEASKTGCSSDEARMLCERIRESRTLHLAGFMTIGPLEGGEKSTRASFAQLRSIARQCSDLLPEPELSMGMSNDFSWAIEEGSTMVRIGTLLMGGRTP